MNTGIPNLGGSNSVVYGRKAHITREGEGEGGREGEGGVRGRGDTYHKHESRHTSAPDTCMRHLISLQR